MTDGVADEPTEGRSSAVQTTSQTRRMTTTTSQWSHSIQQAPARPARRGTVELAAMTATAAGTAGVAMPMVATAAIDA